MSPRSLRQILRKALVLAPLVAGTSCGGDCKPSPYPIRLAWDGHSGMLADGSIDCLAACTSAEGTPDPFPPLIADAGCTSSMSTDGQTFMTCSFEGSCSGGRRPSALLQTSAAIAGHPIGAFFAEAARLEAASVTAFRVLERELGDHGAPKRFQQLAARAATDEVAHTRLTSHLARRYGSLPTPARLTASPATRTLEELARENAVEGCVRETYGVLEAAWQARHAADPVIRRAMATIAEDELRHAELAWAVDAWVLPRLSRAVRGRVAEAKAGTLQDLAAEQRMDAVACEQMAGRPSAPIARVLVTGLAAQMQLLG